jgi:double zinc ribbon protein
MQNETLRGDSPAAARGASARDVRLCVACLHENRHADPACEACGTSLFLVLCPACEAANGTDALQCHSCGAAFGVEADDKPAVAPRASRTSPERTEASEEPETARPVGRMSLVRTEARDDRAPPPASGMSRGRFALTMAAVVVVTAAVTYHFSARIAQADRVPQGKVVEVAPVKSVEPPLRTDPKAGGPSVTHTQPADAGQTAASAPVARTAVIEAAPVKSVQPPARVPPPRTEPKVVAPIADPAYSASSHVTHTRRADVGQAAPVAAVAAPVATVAAPAAAVAAPAAGQKSDSGCGEAIAALGLCNSRVQSGGK